MSEQEHQQQQQESGLRQVCPIEISDTSAERYQRGYQYLMSLNGKECVYLKTFFHEARAEYQAITGVPLVINRSRQEAGNMQIGCYYGGSARDGVVQSRKAACPFRLSWRLNRQGRVQITTLHPEHNHNHDPTTLGSLPLSRALPYEAITLIKESKLPNRTLADILRQTNDMVVTAKSISLIKASVGRNRDSDLSAAIIGMQEQGIKYEVELNTALDGGICVHGVVFTHADEARDFCRAPEVLLMDCTYNTTNHKLPCINFVSVDRHMKSTLVATGLIFSESTRLYAWALSAFVKVVGVDPKNVKVLVGDDESALRSAAGSVFGGVPFLQCRWHLILNLTKKLRAENALVCHQINDDLYHVADSMTEAQFFQRWTVFKRRYGVNPAAVKYMDKMELMKDQWVDISVAKLPHMGCTTSSRVEGIHNSLKIHLQNKATFLNYVEASIRKFGAQIAERREADARSIDRRHLNLPVCLQQINQGLPSCVREILLAKHKEAAESSATFEEVHGGFKFENAFVDGDYNCDCADFRTMLLPCRHVFMIAISRKLEIPLVYFAKRWAIPAQHLWSAIEDESEVDRLQDLVPDVPIPVVQPLITLPETFAMPSFRGISKDEMRPRFVDFMNRAFSLLSTGIEDRDKLASCLERMILPPVERAVAFAQQPHQLVSQRPDMVALPSKTAVRGAPKGNKNARKRLKSDVEKEGKLKPKKK